MGRRTMQGAPHSCMAPTMVPQLAAGGEQLASAAEDDPRWDRLATLKGSGPRPRFLTARSLGATVARSGEEPPEARAAPLNFVFHGDAVVRNSRTVTRIMFATVLAAGLIGAWVASSMWSVDVTTLSVPGLESEADWVDAASLVGEQLIQFFLGWTNGGGG